MRVVDSIRLWDAGAPRGAEASARMAGRAAGGNAAPSPRGWVRGMGLWFAILLSLAVSCAGAWGQTYKITAAYFEETNNVQSTIVPAGVNGATLMLYGTLPSAAQQSQTSLLGCFYTGYGSTAGIPLALPNGSNTEPLVVPAATIQGIPPANFTAANGFSVPAKVYFIQSGQVCDGTFDSTLTNQFTISVVAPSLTAYGGPTSVPQTNAATGVQAAPATLTFPAIGYRDDSGTNGSVSTVSFGTFGTATAKLVHQNVLSVPVPASFASSPVGTTASLSLCFTASAGSSYTVCTTPSPAISLTVAALTVSAGTIAATPTPVLTSGQTVLAAQFAKSSGATGSPGAPSGMVSFAAGGTTLPSSKLVLDTTATFAAQTTSVTTPVTATPAIAPAAGTYSSAQTISITDATPGAAIYYTQDGSTPTTASTRYNGSFSISTTQTVQAIAIASGALTSAVASAAYTFPTPAPTPMFSPMAGSYTSAQTIMLSDSLTSATIYYTQDGSTPTTSSTQYTVPFRITTSQTIQAIAVAAGYLNSAVGSAAYTITAPPSQLAFVVQPLTSAINTAITPAVQVAIEDVNGNVVTSATSAVTLALNQASSSTQLGGTTTVNAVNGIATFPNLTINNIGSLFTLQATSGNLTPATSSPFNVTLPTITMTVQSTLVGIGSTLSGGFTLQKAVPAGAVVTVNLSSSVPANVTISPASVNLTSGQTTGSFTYTGVAAGSSTLSASATNYQTGTVQATGTSAQVSLSTIPAVAPGQSVSLALSLATAAPPGGTTVTFTSSNTGVATVTSSVFVPAGMQVASTNPQVTGVTIGSTTITANAPGYAPAVRTANVTVTASFNPGTTNINLSTSTNTTLNLSAPAQTGGLTFTLSSDSPAIATVPATVTVVQGATAVPIAITGVSAGTTTIRADYPGVTEATGTVNVASAIAPNAVTTGVHLTNSTSISLPVSPPNPVTVTVTANGPSTATLSTSPTTVGTTTLTFTNVTSSYVGTIYVQGQTIGSTTYTVSATGYTSGSGAITVDPSGYAFYGDQSFSTTSFSNASTLTIYSCILNPSSLTVLAFGYPLNPGLSTVSVPVTSGTTSVGTIVTSPVVFKPGDAYEQTTFQPSSAGTSTISIGTPPAPFSVTSQYQQITATVTAPQISVGNVTTGAKLQNTASVYIPQSPPSPVTVTVTSGTSRFALLSTSPTTVGSASLTFTVSSAGYLPTIYVQGQNVGSTTLTASATGYTTGSGTITIDPAGFTFYGNTSFTTTTFSSPTTLTVYASILDPQSLQVVGFGYALNPDAGPVNVPITSGTTSVGTITTSPLVFTGNSYYQQTTFQPATAGTSTISIGAAPTGFSTPSQYQQITATVTAPALSIGGVTTGVNLQNTINVYVPQSPPSAETVTVTSSGGSIATISKSGSVVGGTSLTFTVTAAGYLPTIYVQGQSVGSVTLTASAPGYTTATSMATVDPSGFTFYGDESFTTTTFSSTTTLTVYASILNPGSLSVYSYGYALNPNVGPITLPISDSATSVGTISAGTLTFNPGDYYKQFTFQPVAAGTATVAIASTPTGFSTPSQSQSLTATVTAPALSIGSTTTGLNLESTVNVYVPVAPPSAETVTVVSNGPAIATISTDGTVVGGTTLTFTGVTSGGYLPTIYVQGQALGSTTLTVSAPGYTNGTGTVTVDPAGFTFYGTPNFTTSATSSPTTLTVYASSLTPGTLTAQTIGLQVNPGMGNVSVPVVSSDPTVGTIGTSPIVFVPGAYYTQTTFVPVASGTSTITIQTPANFSTPSQYTQITGTVQ